MTRQLLPEGVYLAEYDEDDEDDDEQPGVDDPTPMLEIVHYCAKKRIAADVKDELGEDFGRVDEQGILVLVVDDDPFAFMRGSIL